MNDDNPGYCEKFSLFDFLIQILQAHAHAPMDLLALELTEALTLYIQSRSDQQRHELQILLLQAAQRANEAEIRYCNDITQLRSEIAKQSIAITQLQAELGLKAVAIARLESKLAKLQPSVDSHEQQN